MAKYLYNYRIILTIIAAFSFLGLGWLLVNHLQAPVNPVAITPALEKPEVSAQPNHRVAVLEERLAALFSQIDATQTQQRALVQTQQQIVQNIAKLEATLDNIQNSLNATRLYPNKDAKTAVPGNFSELQEQIARQKQILSERVDQPEIASISPLDSQMAVQAIDTTCSGVAEDQIRDFFATDSAQGSSLQTVECRTTLCRIRVIHDSEEAKDQFIAEFPNALPWETEAYIENNDEQDGKISTVVYLSREGHSLPDGPNP